jgi:hypothetical protein
MERECSGERCTENTLDLDSTAIHAGCGAHWSIGALQCFLHCALALSSYENAIACISTQATTLGRISSMRHLFGTPSTMDEFFEDEKRLWRYLKGTNFWCSLQYYIMNQEPLAFGVCLRSMLQTPSHISVDDLIQMFLEEDTIGILTAVTFPGLLQLLKIAMSFRWHVRICEFTGAASLGPAVAGDEVQAA